MLDTVASCLIGVWLQEQFQKLYYSVVFLHSVSRLDRKKTAVFHASMLFSINLYWSQCCFLFRNISRTISAGQTAAAEASTIGRRPQRQDLPPARSHRAGSQEHPLRQLLCALTTGYLSFKHYHRQHPHCVMLHFSLLHSFLKPCQVKLCVLCFWFYLLWDVNSWVMSETHSIVWAGIS